MNNELQRIIREGSLLPEDITKLNTILEKVRLCLDETMTSMPLAVQSFLQQPSIEPLLREGIRDEIKITVKFYRSSGSVDSVCLIQGNQTFYVECLDPDIEKTAEEKFKDIVLNYVRECCQFLDETADTLQLASDFI